MNKHLHCIEINIKLQILIINSNADAIYITMNAFVFFVIYVTTSYLKKYATISL